MKEKGLLSNFLISKLSITFAFVLLLGSILTTYQAYERTIRKEKANLILETISKNIREANSLPGKVQLKKKIPALEGGYRLNLSGNFQEYQIIRIRIESFETHQKTIFIGKKINNGKFRIVRKNPMYMIVRKNNQISLEVI